MDNKDKNATRNTKRDGRSCKHFGETPSPHKLPMNLTDGPFLNQNTYKGNRISYSRKHKYSSL